MRRENLLFELGCEELPPNALVRLAKWLAQDLGRAVREAKLDFTEIRYYASPRRLACILTELTSQQPDQSQAQMGPYLSQAFTAEGEATPAALGFARRCGVEVEALDRATDKKGERLFYQQNITGKTVQELMPMLIQKTLATLPVPKLMHWGVQAEAFIRPVHWAILLYGKEVINAEFYGVKVDQLSYGHRFHHPQALKIEHADDYVAQLRDVKVMVDHQKCQAIIKQGLHKIFQSLGVATVIPEDLLATVSAIVEWPVPILCDFDARFLTMPRDVIMAVLHQHQKCFHCEDKNGQLRPHFVAISNIESSNPSVVKAGNERVVQARLADAAFFFQSDAQHLLSAHSPRMAAVTYHQKLGSLSDKVARLNKLVTYLAPLFNEDVHTLQRAAELAKCDLLTAMVGEFPELQGVIGGHYARQQNEAPAVATAIAEHYLPRHAADNLPESRLGCLLSIADRVDKLVGYFGIEEIPTGEKDPYALRRSAIGLIQILIDTPLSLNLVDLVTQAATAYQVRLTNRAVIKQTHDFILERMRIWLQDTKNIPVDVFSAVRAREDSDLSDMHQRMLGLVSFQQLAAAASLTAADKRVGKLLKKTQLSEAKSTFETALFEQEAETALAKALLQKQKTVAPMLAKKQYQQTLHSLAELQQPIDDFFDHVMVMVDEPKLRENRLGLLTQLQQLFHLVADISRLQ